MAEDMDHGLTGAAFDLANAGYSAMPDPEEKREAEAIGSDHASLRQAAERQSRAQEHPAVKRQYTDGDGEPVSAKEAITLARAARDYGKMIEAERRAADSDNAKLRSAQSDARQEEPFPDERDIDFPDADHLRTSADEMEPVEGGARQDGAEDGGSEPLTHEPSAELDAELQKALQHPQVLQAIEERVGEAEKARQSYRDGLTAATQIAQVALFGQFPELANISQEHLPAALEQMSRQDPARFSQVKAMVATAEHLLARQAQEDRMQAEAAHQTFLKRALAEDARLEAMLKDEPKATQQAVMAEIVASAKASGIDPAELNRLFQTEPVMRNATFQRMMYDAGKYRLMMKARDAAVSRPVPPVQRPGMATTRSERERADLRMLSGKLSASGDIKDAVALYQARKSGRK